MPPIPEDAIRLGSAFFLALVISWVLTAFLSRWAPRLGLIDQPSPRKVHVNPTPKGGGLAIYFALLLTYCIPRFRYEGGAMILAVGAGIVLLGLIDDRRPLPWQLRLGLQFFAAWLVTDNPIFSGPGFEQPRPLLIPLPLAVLWIVAMVNAFNMLDNMDGLSGGVALIAGAGFAWALLLRPRGGLIAWDWETTLPYVTLLGGILGFLWFNRPPARIFMGDAGSTFLGFFLAVQSLYTPIIHATIYSPMSGSGLTSREVQQTCLAIMCILAVPIYDMTTVILLRLSQGRSPFHADKQHFSHRLTQLGIENHNAVRAIFLLACLSAIGGGLLYQMPGSNIDNSSPPIKETALVLVTMGGGLAILEFVLHRWRRKKPVAPIPTTSPLKP